MSLNRFRNWCFTLNNYSDDEYEEVWNTKCKYLVIGKEIGENGTPHLQGYIEFENGKTLTAIKKINSRIHWESRRGTSKQASDYCKKDNNFKEQGMIASQGHRTDLDEVTSLVLQKDFNPLEYASTYVKYHSGLDKLIGLTYPARDSKPQVHWLHGKAGTGKTRYVIDNYTDVYIKDHTKWWNGYKQQEVILIDDFDSHLWEFRVLLLVLDRYPYQGEYKGGYINVNSPIIYVTCEFHPSKYWKDNDLAQVSRRLDSITELTATSSVESAPAVHCTEVGGNTIPPLVQCKQRCADSC